VGRIRQIDAWGNGLIGAEASLLTLLGWSFLASTLVPISSEAALFAVLKLHPELAGLAIGVATPEHRLSDIGKTVQRHAESQGFSVVRDFVGHGIGTQMHEEPQVPNYFDRELPRLRPGLVIAIEPMINAGTYEVKVLDDGWTAITKDRSLSAHFEHSVAITEGDPVVLSRL